MAPTVREKLGNNVTGAPVSIVTGAGTAAGDTLAIFTAYNFYLASHMNAPTISGQTVVDTGVSADAGTDNPHIKLYTCSLSSGGAKTITFTVGGPADADLTMIAYVLQGACELDGTTGTGFNATPTTSHLINDATPGTADSLLLGSVVRLHGGVLEAWTVPSGMTDLLEVLHSGGGQASAQQVLTASGSTGTRTFTLDGGGGGRTYAGVMAAFKVSGAATNATAEAATATAVANDATTTNTNIRKVADRGSVQNTTTGTTSAVDLAAGASIAVGNYLIARLALDNAGTSGAAPTLSVSDPGGNAWTVVGPANLDPGAANVGVTCYIAYAKVTTGLANGDDVTFTYDVSVPAKAIVVEEWANVHATTPIAVAATTTVTVGSSTPSIARTPLAIGQLFYGALAVEGPAGDTYTEDTDTTDGAWVTLTRLSTTHATASNNQTINGATKLVTGTAAQTWNPTITLRDWAQVALVLAEATAATSATSEHASATGTAGNPAPSTAPSAELASAAASAHDASAITGGATSVPAEAASASGAADSPAVVTGAVVTAECATATSAALDGTTQISTSAEIASAIASALFDGDGGSINLDLIADAPVAATAEANNATISTAVEMVATAQVAAATATAETLSAAVAIHAEHAAGAASAGDATAAIAAVAEHAAGSAAAEAATVGISPLSDTASAAAGSNDATVATSGQGAATAGIAAATATALDVTATVPVGADVATAAGVAENATVSTAAGTNAVAESAAATATACDPAAAVLALVGSAAAACQALDPIAAVLTAASAAPTLAVAAALDPSAAVRVSAGCAEAVGATSAYVAGLPWPPSVGQVTISSFYSADAPVVGVLVATADPPVVT